MASVRDLLEKRPGINARSTIIDENVPRIEASRLTIGFPNEVVVEDINFDLKAGEAVAIIGTNGSGKSTLLKTVVGLLKPLAGSLSVLGGAPGANNPRLSYLGQFHHSGFVLPIRAIDVVRMGRFPLHGLWKPMVKKDEEIVKAAMHTMGIEKLAETPLRSLSGGQQQRTYLAQALAHQADLLVLDEPTAGLDAGGRELYLHAINDELCRGASIIVATHDIQEEAYLCHQVLLLARKVIVKGAPQDVLTPEALLEAFGIVVTDEKHIHVLECKHGHDDAERMGTNKPRK
jgi:ABC-type Mn2+/Zn2+ transport system ATPase subunit